MRAYTNPDTEAASAARGRVPQVLALAVAIVITVACSGCIQGPESIESGAVATGPGISRISPRSGTEAGGDTVTIIGGNFAGLREVKFGNTRALHWTLKSDHRIIATSPPGTGTVNITVVVHDTQSAPRPGDRFTYAPGPTTSPSKGSSS